MKVCCQECGIAAQKEDNSYWCEKFKFPVCVPGEKEHSSCNYFIKTEFDGDEPLNAKQHLLLKENDLASRHMRGPV